MLCGAIYHQPGMTAIVRLVIGYYRITLQLPAEKCFENWSYAQFSVTLKKFLEWPKKIEISKIRIQFKDT